MQFGRPIYRTLRVDILTLFLSLFIISFASVITFIYFQQIKAIEEFSLGTVERVSNVVLERINNLVRNSTRFAEITESLVWDTKEIDISNEALLIYLQRMAKSEREIANIFVASTDGSFLGVSDLSLSSQRYLITNPSQKLPENAAFSVFYDDDTTSPPKNIWVYKDKDFNVICSEEIDKKEYDPRNRAWYQDAIKKNGLVWSDVFVYFPTKDTGVSVSEPIHDKQENVIGVSGVNVTFALLSQFLSKLEVGKSGQVFLLNNKGEDVLKNETLSNQKYSINYQTVADVFHHYEEMKENTFIIESEKEKYLAHINPVAIGGEEHWLVTVIVPYKDFFGQIVQTEERAILIVLCILFVSIIFVVYFSKRISLPIVTLSKEIDKMKHLELSSEVRINSNIREIRLMDISIASMRAALRSFATYVPRGIVQKLLEKGESISLGGEKKEITVLFSDIADFTSIADALTTEEVMSFLSVYFDELSKIIIKDEGLIDKYMGDGIMAFWGAPVEIPDHAFKACRAALHCQAFLKEFNDKRKREGKPELHTRIAINSGTVIIGNIGTIERMNYTAMGDAVNTAAHLQQVNKIYHTKTIITEETYKQIMGMFLVRPLDIFLVRGKKRKMKIYELVAILQGDGKTLAQPEQIELCELFSKGFEAYHAKNLKAAEEIFLEIQRKFPDDFPTQIYLERIKNPGKNDLQ